MSGGHWNYANDNLASDVLGYRFYVGYGLDGDRHDDMIKLAVKEKPLGDPEISALVYDVFCLLHSYDWAVSADTSMEAYQEDVEIFKNRWFKKTRKEQVKKIVDISINALREDLYLAFQCAEEQGEPSVH